MENNVYGLTRKLWDKMGLNYRYVPNKGMSVDFEDSWWGMQVLKGSRSGVKFTVSLKGLVSEERLQMIFDQAKNMEMFGHAFAGLNN